VKSVDPGALAFWHSGGDVIRVDPHRAAVAMGPEEAHALSELLVTEYVSAVARRDEEAAKLLHRESIQLLGALNDQRRWRGAAGA
jgi:hypothetical protein